MKVLLVLFCAVFVVVLGERCSQTSDCTVTGCADNSHHLICANHECTCSSGPNGQTCSGGSGCGGTHCRFGNAHCVDGHCHCIGGIGK